MSSIIGKYIVVGVTSFIAGGVVAVIHNKMIDKVTTKDEYKEPALNEEIPSYIKPES